MRTHTIIAVFVLAALAAAIAPRPSSAQTDFYNLDKDRPLRVEDAYATKRYAFELQLSPLTLYQDRHGTLFYRPAVELKHGLLPGLDVAAGLKPWFARVNAGPGDVETRRLDTELELTSLINLTTETRWLPALGVRVTGHIPLEGDHGSTLEVRGLATRSLGGPVRAHLNGGWTFGEDVMERWWAGLALDYVLPFHHLLLLAETWIADEPPRPTEVLPGDRELPATVVVDDPNRRVRIHSTAGLRYQVSPVWALDAGLGRTWAGSPGQDWMLTLGLTYEFAVRGLMPGARR